MLGTSRAHNGDHYLAIRFDRGEETLLTSLAETDLPPPFREYAYALLVADGGGLYDSDGHASRLVLSALAYLAIRHAKWHVRSDPDTWTDIMQQLEYFSRLANEVLREASRAGAQFSALATSVTGVYIAGSDLFFAHVGHSKGFLVRSGGLVPLTRDRGWTTTRGLDATPPSRLLNNALTEVIGGGRDRPKVDIEHVQLFPGDRVVLCTNGLTDVLSEDELADVLTLRRRPQEDCQQLVDLARGAGATDDVTVMLADYSVQNPT
jgi:protein phosphatase